MPPLVCINDPVVAFTFPKSTPPYEGAVPLTPGGVGVMEELYLIYFVSASNNNKVLLLAVLVRFTIMISSLPGGLVALLDKQTFKTNIKEVRNAV